MGRLGVSYVFRQFDVSHWFMVSFSYTPHFSV